MRKVDSSQAEVQVARGELRAIKGAVAVRKVPRVRACLLVMSRGKRVAFRRRERVGG